MATEFNTQIGNGKYCLQFETDDEDYYLIMQEIARRCIDGRHITNTNRVDGCEYCNDGSIIYNADEEFYISGNTLRVDMGCHSYGLVNINFCPMCGRRLHSPKPTPSEANN